MASKKNKGSGCGSLILLIIIAVAVLTVGATTGAIIIAGFIVAVIIAVIIAIITNNRQRKILGNKSISQLSPVEYENFIADYLLKCGYRKVKTTKTSGDFGADVLCENAKGMKI